MAGRHLLLANTSLLALVIGAGAAMAQSVPTGGTVTSGQATIGTSGSGVVVNQTSQNAIISWQSFSIGGGATAHFENGSGATLNRVTGNLPSSIDGSLTATGSVYLINPAGVAIGTGGMVRTGGSFVASTHDAADADFLNGGDLTLKGDSKAAVTNQGTISSQSGDVVLTARRVENSGTIDAPNGSVGLLGGYEVLLRDTSLADGKFSVKVGGADTQVVNSGTIRAAEAELRANGGSVQALAGNTKGVIKATGVKKSGGRIFLTAGDEGTVEVTQEVVARRAETVQARTVVAALPDNAPLPQGRPDFSGGEVQISGGSISLRGTIDTAGSGGAGGAIIAVAKDSLDIAATGRLDASGTDGGVVLLGGDYQGGKNVAANYWTAPLGTTADTTVAAGAVIKADGDSGAGGKVVVWADHKTSFAGAVSATGVSRGGDAEVSGKALLAYTGSADLRATSGVFGNLLLDPYNITISNDADSGGFTATGDDSVINVGTLEGALALANVTVSTGSDGSQAGNITIAAPLGWTSNATLTLQAAGAININADITATLGGLTLNAGGSIGATGALSLGRFTLASGNWVQNSASLPAFSATDFRITGGSFLRAAGGNGAAATPYLLADIYGLQGAATMLSANYKLANDIDASGTAGWNDGAGFVPIGDSFSNNFAATFDGAGHVISGLTINRGDYVGLFGFVGWTASIKNVGLAGGTFVGNNMVGSLAGYTSGGTISNVWSTASVTGASAGGLVGANGSTITQSYATGTVTGTYSGSGGTAGGLVARNNGTITRSFATGAVKGVAYAAGGLVGNNSSTITNSYATGDVRGIIAGGLAGINGYQISGSYATGDVYASGGPINTTYGGGLVGYNNYRIVQSYATGSVSSTGYFAGGLAGYNNNTGALIAQSYATGAVSSNAYAGGLVGYNLFGSVSESWASGVLSGSTSGGLIAGGDFSWGGSVTSSYWDIGTTGVTTSFGGGTGLTTAQARDASNYAGWDFANNWFQAGGMRPIGRWEAATPVGGVTSVSNAHQLQLLNIALNDSYVLTGNIDASATQSTDASSGIWGTAGFVSIGTDGFNTLNNGNGFRGSFDGGGYTIAGLTINRPTANRVGLFGFVNSNSSNPAVANVGLVGGSITGYDEVGGLVGKLVTGTISQTYSTAAVSGHNYIGGLIGNNYVFGFVTRSYATGAVNGNFAVGGFAGSSDSGITLSYATGAVNGAMQVGGFIGTAYGGGGIINHNWSSGAVSGGNAGGFAGNSDDGTIANSYWDIGTSGQAGSQGGSGLTTVQARNSFYYAGFDFTNDWYQNSDMRPIGRWEAARPVNGVATISNLHQLQLINFNLAGRYVLAGDLDASATGSGNATSGIWGDEGFVSIGNSADKFTGDFNGNGHVISGLTISRNGNYGGLFGYIDYTGSVEQIGLIGASVTGLAYIGALAGQNDGTISRAYATGVVNGDSFVGGLVGGGLGSIEESFATADVSASGSMGGGLIGSNGGRVDRSYATGNVSGWDSLGGLVGYSTGTITDSYSIGAVSGAANVGGLVGYNRGDVARAYASGAVSGGAGTTGGLIGNYASGTLQSLYWDTATAAQAIGSGSTGGIVGLTAAQMTDPMTSFAGFDFDNVWARAGNGYRPELYGVSGVIGVKIDDASMIYGDGVPGFAAPTYVGAGYWNTLTSGAFLSTSATSTSNVGTYSINGSGAAGTFSAGGASRIVYTSGELTVDQRAITVTADAASKIYGDDNPAFTYTVGGMGLVNGDTLFGELATQAGSGTGVGNYAIEQGTVTSLNNPNYAITYNAADLTIGQRTITVTVDASGKIYDGNANATVSLGDDRVAGDYLEIDYTSALFDNANAGTGKTVTVGGLSLSGASAANYTLNSVTSETGVADIGKASLLVTTHGDQTKTYDGTGYAGGATVSYDGLVNNEDASVLSGTLSVSALDGNGHVAVNAGTYAIKASGLSSGNYDISYGDAADNAKLTIGQRAVTVTADAKSRLYGNANPSLTYSIDNVVDGDTLSVSLQTDATATSDVGTYGIALNSGLIGNDLGNYRLDTYNGADLTVAQRAITLSADAKSRLYGNSNPALTFGAVGGDGLASFDTLASAGYGLTTSAQTSSGVGAYGITLTGSNDNYAVTYTGADLTVNQRTITLNADAKSRLYGNANPALTFGAVGGDGLASFDTLASAGYGLTTSAQTSSGVGAYGITLTGSNDNYAVTYTGADLTVNQRTITLNADAKSRLYGNANPALTFGAVGGDGLASFDTLASAGYGLTTSAQTSSGVGAYGITLTGSNDNYAVTYTGADLTVNQRAITLSADAKSRLYGDANPALTFGAVGGDGLASFDTLASAGYGLITSAQTTSGVGAYGITLTGSNDNYAVTYSGADLTVNQRAITLSANNAARAYGDANPALTFGAVGGDGLASFDSMPEDAGFGLASSATANSNVGSYAITLAATNTNYAVTFTPGTLTVNQRAITVTADNQSRLQGQSDPMLGYSLTGGSLASFDSDSSVFTGALVRAPGEAVGGYAISQGSLAANSNYVMTFVGGVLSIGPAQVTVSRPLETTPDQVASLLPAPGGQAGEEDEAQCKTGVIGGACASQVYPDNRRLGPFIGFSN
jgi:filamentous hemagglutinin family protein